ncbi:hypothetical protein E5E91_15655 (plasmid) [Deinococcus radiodurans R1 = ATCC 13939 = DSM 20539]|uniref:Uncharacterized protein n=1 Tax=Deinococcus radiodurans (strain ATCC 13939 / DSM 20539 / JCM 16871 / CCUG 27074 / LMG 4051 / NBRC 15346 / NCIMB 9279 / VKM B-1422 / R1) TaxID=243230 RepID=Q9RZU2_DEIRA|nr:hypothetical protein DR_B0021 [Deinococcus radiodurans R1 = ATCC 13939 = DSM 20539]ANC73303.1 hypothetical protein A2G07_15215 [Deinococcus radiodurans R1 = ATCC 13939 = DSM 20539]QEM73358.1 hypothetical protein DXG80_16150 [Deinococcus radiodurans]UDL02159.1 hypothetical protein E5E91_15655 [Deinococcus radiodurans R1 = ATCC 13939 = DSM 20539]
MLSPLFCWIWLFYTRFRETSDAFLRRFLLSRCSEAPKVRAFSTQTSESAGFSLTTNSRELFRNQTSVCYCSYIVGLLVGRVRLFDLLAQCLAIVPTMGTGKP